MIRKIILYKRCMPLIVKSRLCTNSEEVIINEFNNCGVITLNRPNVLNSLNLNMINIIYKALLKWKDDSSINHVLIDAAGPKAFCAGGDIRKITEDGKSNFNEACKFFESEYKLNYLIGTFNKPYIALINGITMGGGVGLSVHGKYRIATENTVFAMPESSIGLYPDVGGSYFLSRMPDYLGVFLGLLGYKMKGKHVYSTGVATHFVTKDCIGKLKEDILNAKCDSDIEDCLNFYHLFKNPEDYVDELEKDKLLTKKYFCKPTIESICESLKTEVINKSKYQHWCREHIETLNLKSPTSLKIISKQLNCGRYLSLRECFIMEYRISVRCLENKDFYEGVRAVLVDKDMKPKWQPATIEETKDEMIDEYFKPLPRDIVL